MNINRPSDNEIKKSIKLWNNSEPANVAEKTLFDLFSNKCKEHNLENILIKATTLNSLYSTNILNIFAMAKNIYSIKDLDKRIKECDYSVIDEIMKLTIKNKTINCYSFATKYCFFSNPEKFPIYDSYVDKLLRYFNKVDKFSALKKFDLKDYQIFINVLNEFKTFYKLEKWSLKEIDHYLWLEGKRVFRKM